MCGIASIWHKKINIDDLSPLNAMVESMFHRGPDGEGQWKTSNIALGHRRLAIIDLSDGGKQPMVDAYNRYVITFNGEIFNYKLLKEELTDYPYKSDSDTEVILAAIHKYGLNFPTKLKGQFALAIWDQIDKQLILCRDRMGEKPLYYFQDENYFLIASEIHALLSSALVPKRLDQVGLADYLKYQSVNEPNTIIENVKQLPAGCIGLVKEGDISIQKYFEFKYTNLENIDPKSYLPTIKSLFQDAVAGQMQSDVPLGAFLSGGIDSSAIVSQMVELTENKINTFTISFSEKEFDESHYAEIVAKKYGTHHTKITLEPNVFIDSIEDIFDAMDHPSGDGPNTYVVSKAVKNEGITVALSGLGGDDLFAGYKGFTNYYALKKYENYLKFPMLNAILYWMYEKKTNTSVDKEKMKKVLLGNHRNLVDFYALTRTLCSDETVSKLMDLKNTPDQLKENLKQINTAQFPILSQYSICELSGYTRSVLLSDGDTMSMANSLEVRCPFLDHDLINFVLSIPDKFKYPSSPKKLLTEALGGILPSEIVDRKKMGFSFPWDKWMRFELRKMVNSKINQLANRSILNRFEILNLYSRFENGDPSIKWSKIWLLVCLEAWLEKNKF